MNRPEFQKLIEKRIADAPHGEAFITADFLDIADTQAVNKALSRLTEDKSIRRIIRGVYDRPYFSELLQEYTAPRMEAVAKAIARNFGWTIIPCGDTALNLLGMSTQVPAVWIYVSDGPYREYDIDGIPLKFKHTTNKEISKVSYKTALAIQALKALGEGNVDSDAMQRLALAMSAEEKSAFLLEAQYSTAWIYEIAQRLREMEKKHE